MPKAPRWTAEEDIAALTTHPTLVVKQYPHRNEKAVRARRYALGYGTKEQRAMWKKSRQTVARHKTWTPEEDRAIMRAKNLRLVAERIGRTRGSCATRRCHLRNPQKKPTPGLKFTPRELRLIRLHWPTAKHARDVRVHMPRFTCEQIRNKAHHMKVKRLFVGDSDVWIEGNRELLDQIRLRCAQDGIPFTKMDALFDTGYYWRRHWKETKTVNLRAVNKAVEFFGAKLVIDWTDRAGPASLGR